ncbi:MAG: peptidase domain-containing ABC transporter [Flavobacteriales bacterium]
MNPLRRLYKLLENDKKDLGVLLIYALLSGLLSLAFPLGVQAITTFLMAGTITSSWFVLILVIVVGIITSGIFEVLQITITETLQQKIFTRASLEFSFRVLRFKKEELINHHPPELINRFFDILSVQKGLSKVLLEFSGTLLQIIFALILLSIYHPLFIIFSIILIAFLYSIFRYIGPSGYRTKLVESKYKYKLVHWLEELARVMDTFKLAGKTPFPLNKTDDLTTFYLESRTKHFRILVIQYISVIVFKTLTVTGLLVAGSLLVIDQQLSLGQFIAAEILIILIMNSSEKLIRSLDVVYDLLVSLEKVGTVTDIGLERLEGSEVEDNSYEKGIKVEISDLSFKPNDSREKILKHINFTINPGEKICISGGSGAGKSTLLNLIAGLFETYDGNIYYNDISIKSIKLESLRSFIGDSLSYEDIFEGTLMENISLGKENVTEKDVEEICKKIGLSNYLRDAPKGIHTELFTQGRKLSRSVIKKIILARSIVDHPKLLVLEDLLVNIPIEEMENITNIFFEKKSPWSLVIASNNSRTAAKCDRVIMLNDGEIITEGTYDALKDKYSKIFY